MSRKSERWFVGEEGITAVVRVEGFTFYGNINNGTVQNSLTDSQVGDGETCRKDLRDAFVLRF